VALECRRMVMIDIAVTRSLVVGQVVAMHVHDDCVTGPAHVDTPRLDLVGHMHGEWYARTSMLEEVRRVPLNEWRRG
jgi:flavin reductase (DIM6/NTAB) family NADH-FMN oxidoreductase RutF